MKRIAFCIFLLCALLSPALAAPADTARAAAPPVPPAAQPAKPPAMTPVKPPAPAAADVPDTVDYESMILPESEQDYWSLDYYRSDDTQEDTDWEDNRRERDDQGADGRSDQAE